MLYDRRWDIGTTGRVLLHAAHILDRDGWCKGFVINEQGQYCALGAIRRAAYELGLPSTEAHMAQERLHQHLGQRVMVWNDAMGITKEQVIATLRAVSDNRDLGR